MAHVVRRPKQLTWRRPRGGGRARERRLHAASFAVSYVALALVVCAAAVAAYLLATRDPAPTSAVKKAPLVPAQAAGLGTYALKALAYGLQQQFRLPNGSPLVTIIARPSAPPQFVTPNGPVAISAMTIRPGFAIQSPRDDRAYDVSKAAMFVLCGAGTDCAIPAKASGAEKAELQREIVQLSLRTLGKLQSVDAVLTFIPPASAKRLVYLTRGDLSSPPRGRRATGALIGAHTFAVQSISALPDGSAYLAATPAS